MLLFILTKHDIVPIVDVFWLPQKNSTLNATRCTFTSNNAGDDGGAIHTEVGHCMQSATVVENRNHHSNDTVLYYKFLELLVFL